MLGLSEALPVTVSLGETDDHPYTWIDCVVQRVDQQLVALSPRAHLSARLQERLLDGERGYLVFEQGAGSIALRGFLRLAGRGRSLEFLVIEREPEVGFQESLRQHEPLLRLMYVSRAAPGLHEADFNAILREASTRNASSRVTGALCLRDGFFGQILEGPEPAVRDTFARIESDPRHSEPVILLEESAQRRLYGGWTMKGIHGENAITAADELAARLALAQREDSVELTRRWMELLQTDSGPSWREAWLAERQSVLLLRELIEQSAPPPERGSEQRV